MAGDVDGLLAELNRKAIPLLSGGRPDVAVGSQLDQLLALDLCDHPWAQLVVAAALNDLRDDRCLAYTHASLQSFERVQNLQGQGYAHSVLGYIALGRGRLIEAAEWLQRSRKNLKEESPANAINLAHIGLGAYQRGELREAVAITQEALALARIQRARRAEGVACLYLSFFGVITGDFKRVEMLLQVAEDTYLELTDPLERFEYPLVLAGRGVLEALRGQAELAERDFEAALAAASDVDVPWYAAIARTLRAEFTAHNHATRSLADSRNSLEQLVALNDAWWQTWALRAQGTAARAAGDIETSIHILRRVLTTELNPLENGLTLLALGESLLLTDRPSDAVAHLEKALGILDGLGARYWAVRCWLALSRSQPLRSEGRRKAEALSDDDPAYRRLFDEVSHLRICVLDETGVWRGSRRVTFQTRNAELALYSLALAGARGLHEEVLMERLWPGAPADRARARLRTVLWQIRQGLDEESHRLVRDRQSVRLHLDGVVFDLAALRQRAAALLGGPPVDKEEAREVADRLAQPILTAWQYEPWVEAEVERNLEYCSRLRRLRPG